MNMSEVKLKGRQAREESYSIAGFTTKIKNEAISLIDEQLINDKEIILEANEKDLKLGEENGISKAVLDRIMLNEERIKDMSHAIKLLIELEDPVGEVLE